MRRLGALALSTLLIGSPALAGAAYAGGDGASAVDRPGHHGGKGVTWKSKVIDADQSFRGLDAVNRRTAWVGGGSLTDGGAGKVFRTTDGGKSWADVTPEGTEGLQFRDIEARSKRVAVALTIGEGDDSRIYRTTDAGQSWEQTFVNDDPAAFYDCMAFYPDGRTGLALSDPVNGKFRILSTEDAGRTWSVLPSDGMPDATGEAGFAASGDCLVTAGDSAYFGSGGTSSHVFRSDDHGLTWTASDSTIPPGDAAGVFGLAFRSPTKGIAVGGDFSEPTDGTDAVAVTRDGSTWTNTGDPAHLGEDVAYLPHHTLLMTGESGDVMGTSVSTDNGATWRRVSKVGFHTLDCTQNGTCWAAGGNGRVGVVRP